MIQLNRQRFSDQGQRLSRVAAVLGLMGIGDVVQHVGKQDPPRLTLV